MTDRPLTEDEQADYEGGCQNCGRLIDKSAKGYDDIVSAPYVTESGDLYCIPCGREVDRAQEEADEADGFGDYDPYDSGTAYMDEDANLLKPGRD